MFHERSIAVDAAAGFGEFDDGDAVAGDCCCCCGCSDRFVVVALHHCAVESF